MYTWEQLVKANSIIRTMDVKGKEYAEVNQRIKAFRSICPGGSIVTEMLSNQDGVCVFRAVVCDEEGRILGTGTAYEKESSSYINKTSYIENCETSAVGRALGMCGFGIDTSVASAEEVQNAIKNQEGKGVTKMTPRERLIAKLKEMGITPTSMIDVSDGLSSELKHICSQSNCGCRVYEDRLPIDYQTAVMAEELNMNVCTCALNGGEDYELLFTVPITDHEKIEQMEGVKLIGHITKPELGCALITRDGNEFELKAQGWTAQI